MEIKHIAISELIEYGNNIMSHSEAHVHEIAESIRAFGFNDPVAVGPDMILIEGHGRLAAAKLLGLEQVPCIMLSDMTEGQARAYRIAHNKIAKNAVFDLEKLRAEMQALEQEMEAEMASMGFSDSELEGLLSEDLGILPDAAGGYWSGVNYTDSDSAGRAVPKRVEGELAEVPRQEYSQKNKEIDVDSMKSEMILKLKFSEHEYWQVKEAIEASGMSGEDVIKNALGL